MSNPFINMPISMREQILQKSIELLTPVMANLGCTIFRSPTLPIAQDQLPALALYVNEEKAEAKNGVVARTLFIRVDSLARAQGNVPAETVADVLATVAHQALMNSPEKQTLLGPLIQSIRESDLEWEVAEGDGVVVAVPSRYEIEYRTQRNDVTKKG